MGAAPTVLLRTCRQKRQQPGRASPVAPTARGEHDTPGRSGGTPAPGMAPGGHESELWLHQGRHLDHAASPRAPEASTPALGLSSTQRAGVHAGAAAAAAVLAHGSLAAHSRNTVWSVSTNTSVPGGVHAPPMAASAAAMASLASAAVTPSPRCAASWNSRISRSGKLRRARLGCTNWLPRSGASTSCTKLLSPSAGVSEPVCFGMRRMRPDGDPSASQIRQTVCLVPAARRVSDRASAAGCMPASSARQGYKHMPKRAASILLFAVLIIILKRLLVGTVLFWPFGTAPTGRTRACELGRRP